jgi:hypothetical protein
MIARHTRDLLAKADTAQGHDPITFGSAMMRDIP